MEVKIKLISSAFWLFPLLLAPAAFAGESFAEQERILATPVEGAILAAPGSALPLAQEADAPAITKIPVPENEHVQKWIRYFTEKDRERFQRFLNRGDHYRNVVEDMLEENDLPAELYYLAMIESGFRTNAYSTAKAAGVWQFIPDTARRYGLRVDRYVDERRDPIRATEAAAKYLRDLYNAFGSWHLAMAAYNAGEIRVLRAVFKGKSRDFWTLIEKKVLPSETANYVPKFAAVALIGQNPEKYGFKVEGNETFPDLEMVEAPGSLPLSSVASIAGLPLSELRRLNPNIRGASLPPGSGYEIWLPTKVLAKRAGIKAQLAAATSPRKGAKPSREIASTRSYHVVKRGETLASIARKYKISVAHLKRINHHPGNRILAGAKLRINSGTYRSSNLVRYKVRKGDNLIIIAKRFGVPVREIKRSNQLKRSKILVGQTLTISPNRNF
jgi:membrane-bound lytic murein transglycosylase D